jgi:hypothetical protein
MNTGFGKQESTTYNDNTAKVALQVIPIDSIIRTKELALHIKKHETTKKWSRNQPYLHA